MPKTENENHPFKARLLLLVLALLLIISIPTQVFALTHLWNPSQTLDSAGDVGLYTSLAVVNGMPAISYYDQSNSDLKFIRATNASGTSWNPPQTLDNAGWVGSYTSLAIVNGMPAISYYDVFNGELKFVRATNANGTTWDSPQILDSTGDVGWFTSLAVINGMPAISYRDNSNSDLKFIRANDANGTTWDSPQTLDSTGSVGYYTSLAIVNGMPAISYFNNSNGDLKFIRANDANGTTWDSPQTLDSMGVVGAFASLAIVNGMPAVSYADYSNGDLKFIRANDANGTTWDSPQTLDSGGDVGYYSSLAAVNGVPAISYYDQSNSDLKFIRAIGTVDISVWDGVTQINNSDSLDFGSTTLGVPITTTLTIQNNGTFALDLNTLTLPIGFSLTGTYPNEVPSGSNENIQIRLDALQTGTFSGNLEISSSDTNLSPFGIALIGDVTETNGEIAVFEGITEIADGTGSVDYGTTSIGTPISHTFNIRNSSSNDLDLYSLTLPSGFSLQGTYTQTIASGASTNIVVQLDSQIVGSYSGQFSLTNNDTDENPFNFTISGVVTNTSLETGIIAPLNGSTILDSEIQVSFNHDVLHDGSSDAANNPINYLLVEDGVNGIFETTTCLLGLAGDDVQAAINSVTYNDTTFTATLNTGNLSSGRYRLLVCGTASIADASGNVLNNGAFDSSTTFTVVSSGSTSASATGSTGTVYLPATGFAPNQTTALPAQPAELAYSDMDSLTLQIPSLKVDVPIVGVPQTASGWDVTWLTNAQAGWLNGTAYPTWAGNTVLTGHVTNPSGNPGPFANIKSLKFGDQITIQAYGETYTYEVRENKLVTRDNMNIVEEHKDRDWVTLITCETYNENTGQYLFRRVIRAVLVEME